MQLHQLKPPVGSRKRRKIVGRGRGSGHGKTSCRGQKGQLARSGRAIHLSLEGGQIPLIKRLPKVGFRSKRPMLFQIVNLDSLSRFKEGTVINGEFLETHGLIRNMAEPIKILGDGELKKSFTIQANRFSKSAQEKIQKAGGKAELILEKQPPTDKNNKEAKKT